MKKEDNINRNRPTEEGRRNDPDIRDDSAIQPGVQTVSDSKYDDDNQSVSSSAMGSSTISEADTRNDADPTFDEVDREKDGEVL